MLMRLLPRMARRVSVIDMMCGELAWQERMSAPPVVVEVGPDHRGDLTGPDAIVRADLKVQAVDGRRGAHHGVANVKFRG